MSNSIWLRTDLHIHSKKSNEVKGSDYKGPEYNANDLLDKLCGLENPVRLFSVTDHNIINVDLYNDIETLIITDKYKNKINYIIGVELDIHDTKIYKDRFHTLCFFKSRDIKKIDKVIKSFSLEEETDSIADLYELFREINKEQLGSFILIPHFNNKSQGLPASLEELDQLTRLIFDAFEDSNNVENIKKSLAIYLSNGYVDFPFVAFSDCHDISKYPKSEDGEDDKLICDILGSLDYPFDTLKTAFEEPRLRISIQDVDLMRKSKYENYMISRFFNEDVPVNVSNWLNSIIGPFGSGKSLLIDKIINGVDGIQEKYNSVVDKNTSSFQIEINKVKYSSLKEAISAEAIKQIVEIQQYEELYYDSEIKNEYMKNLSMRLGFDLPRLNQVDIDFNVDKLIYSLNKTIDHYSNRSSAYSFRYDKAFIENSGYFVKEENLTFNINDIVSKIEKNEINITQLSELLIRSYKVFNTQEIVDFKTSNKIMKNKVRLITNLEKSISTIDELFKAGIRDFNAANDISTDKEHINLAENTLKDYSDSIITLVKCLREIDSVWTKDVYDEWISIKKEESIDKYKVVIEYDTSNSTYKSILKYMYSNLTEQDTFETRFLDSLMNKSTLRGTKEFNSTNIRDFISKYKGEYLKVFDKSNTKYDLIYDTKNNKSIISLSAGGRAKEVLKMAFSKIYTNIDKRIKTVVVIDQPENNMDNNNIKKLVVEHIKKIKIKDKQNLIQFLVVTHNANVSITSDSENIIIAENNENEFKYRNSSIEDEKFIDDVCEILEGGKDALITRAVKYNINILKGMEITK
ncbi:MAG: hypothetical protein KQ78_00216 [Candidatus Izimaplasma bacterium HR2]|nr:MAG: hypothetical protein KQ78_00216 [Candidatus Izimaplasma bacterium HR2]